MQHVCLCIRILCALAGWASTLGQKGTNTFVSFFFRSGVTNTPTGNGGAVTCARVKILGGSFRSQRTPSAHPSQLEVGVLRGSSTNTLVALGQSTGMLVCG